MTRPTLSVVPPNGGAPPLFDPRTIPPLRATPPAMVTVALPDGAQVQIPGVLWPEPDIWAASEQRTRDGAPPTIEIRQLTRAESNVLCDAWHPLCAERRPFGYHAFALFVKGEPLALATAGTSHSASVDKQLGLTRKNTIELTRLARAPENTHPQAKGTLRVMLRLWRDFLALPYWPYFEDTEKVALISYSMPGKAGHTYIHDGWQWLRACRAWGGRATWSSIPSTYRPPTALFAYWLPGKRPSNADAILDCRHRKHRALLEGRGRPGMAEAARRAA